MPMFRIRPKRQAAIGVSLLAVVILVAGVIVMAGQNVPLAAIVGWIVIGVAALSFLLWSAFARHGAIQTVESDTTPATRPGTDVQSDTP